MYEMLKIEMIVMVNFRVTIVPSSPAKMLNSGYLSDVQWLNEYDGYGSDEYD